MTAEQVCQDNYQRLTWRNMVKLLVFLSSWIGIAFAYPHSVRRHEDYHYPYDHYDPYLGDPGYHVQYDPFTGEHIPNYDHHHKPIIQNQISYLPPSPAPYGSEYADVDEKYQYDPENRDYFNQHYQEPTLGHSGRRYSMHVHPNKIFVEGHDHNREGNHYGTARDTIYFVHRKDNLKHEHQKEKHGYGYSEKMAGKHKVHDGAYNKPNVEKSSYKPEHEKKVVEKPIKSYEKQTPTKKNHEKKQTLVQSHEKKNEYLYDIPIVKTHEIKGESEMVKDKHKIPVKPTKKHGTEKIRGMDKSEDEYENPVEKSHENKTPVKVTHTVKNDYESKIDKRTRNTVLEATDDEDYYDEYEEPVINFSQEHEVEEEYDYPETVESLLVNEVDYESPTVVETLSVKKNPIYKDKEQPTVVKVLTKNENLYSEDEYERPQVVKVLTKKPKKHSPNDKGKTDKDTKDDVKTENYKFIISKINEEEFYLDKINEGRTSDHKNREIPLKNENIKNPKVPKTTPKTTEKPKTTPKTTEKPKTTPKTTEKPKPNLNNYETVNVYENYDPPKKEKTHVKDSLLITKETVDGYNIPIVEAMALEEHENDNDGDTQERLFPPFTDSNTSPEVETDAKDEEIDNFEGSGDLDERSSGKTSRSFFPEDSSVWSVLTGIQSQERSKFKKCTTPRNESGNCMPIQLCPMTNIASSVDELLKNVCVIDDAFIGVCCPEFPVERIQVDWGEFTHTNEDISEGNTQSEMDCGKRTEKAADKDAWPWMTSLISTSSEKVFCSGVLIKEQYVLTAAHCTTRIPRNQIVVRLKHADVIDAKTQDFAVVEIKRHANYNPRTMQNDIAILKLSQKVKLGKFRQIICIPEKSEDFVGKSTSLLRWPSKNKKGHSELLPVISKEDCQRRTGTFISDLIICAEPRNEEATCNADSGAPLVVESGDKYQVIGVLTWNRKDCDERFPSVFTRISSYSGWIKNHAA